MTRVRILEQRVINFLGLPLFFLYDARAETRLESFLQVLCSVAIPL